MHHLPVFMLWLRRLVGAQAGRHSTSLSSSTKRKRRKQRVLRNALRAASILVTSAGSASAQARTAQTADTVRLSLGDARTRALTANPDLAAFRLDTAVARGQLRQAALPLRFNPVADLLGARGGDGLEAGVSQELELFGQRGLRVDARRAGFERAAAGVSDAARRTLGTVDRTFYRLVAASRRLALAEEILGLNQRLADAAQRQLAAGEISRLDFNLAVVELGRSRSRAMSAHRDRTESELELRRLVGLPRGIPLEPVFDPARRTARDVYPLADSAAALDVERLTERALGVRPDVIERAAATKEAAAEAALARREALPNIVLRAVSEPGLNRRVLRPGFGVTMPVFNLNRGESAARHALTRQAELERVAVSSRVRTDIAAAVATYQSAADEVSVLESTVLGPARQNRQLLETAYREGEVGLPVLLLIRNQVIDAELDYWTAWLAEREALAALLEATGANVPTTAERAQ